MRNSLLVSLIMMNTPFVVVAEEEQQSLNINPVVSNERTVSATHEVNDWYTLKDVRENYGLEITGCMYKDPTLQRQGRPKIYKIPSCGGVSGFLNGAQYTCEGIAECATSKGTYFFHVKCLAQDENTCVDALKCAEATYFSSTNTQWGGEREHLQRGRTSEAVQ